MQNHPVIGRLVEIRSYLVRAPSCSSGAAWWLRAGVPRTALGSWGGGHGRSCPSSRVCAWSGPACLLCAPLCGAPTCCALARHWRTHARTCPPTHPPTDTHARAPIARLQEKVRPIDRKLQYQVDKLLQDAAASPPAVLERVKKTLDR